jgi:hypothetical protein
MCSIVEHSHNRGPEDTRNQQRCTISINPQDSREGCVGGVVANGLLVSIANSASSSSTNLFAAHGAAR